MFAVIFQAKIKQLDDEYLETAKVLRDLAVTRYGCLDFVTLTEGKNEIAISYWQDKDSIKRWKQDAAHTAAQKLGRTRWYDSYSVQIVKIQGQYTFNSSS